MLNTLPKRNAQEIGKAAASHFFAHRDKIEQEIAKSILFFGEKNKLRDACEYALTNGGKRFRPLIVHLIAEALGNDLNVSDSALSVEFFHTASLIVDDLPCMDNDDERRNKPSLHKVYGESVALLASYALITAAFEKIQKNADAMREAGLPYSSYSDRACVIALEAASRCAGISGATGGQFYDLHPPHLNLETVKMVIHKKTITLFEVAFVFGWVFGGGDLTLMEEVKKTAYHLGMAFQIADDLVDLYQDEKKQKEISMARLLGKEKAYLIFEEEMKQLQKKLVELELNTPSFEKMSDLICQLAFQSL
jgi:geranylgeranyl diphosphate synthase type II